MWNRIKSNINKCHKLEVFVLWIKVKEKLREIFEFKLELDYIWKLLHFTWIFPLIGVLLAILGVNFERIGPYGDFVAGSTVPILTFISFLAVVITLRMQNKQLDMQKDQLEMQRKELRNSIEEMKAQRMEFEDQNKTLKVQRFENTFFQMVNLHHDIVNAMSARSGGVGAEMTGRKSFEALYTALEARYRGLINNSSQYENYKNKSFSDQIQILWNGFYSNNENVLGHYFRNLYRIIKYIDETNLIDSFDEKKVYIGIIRAQLSSTELRFLLHNSLGSHGEKFLILMYKYDLLDNLNINKLIKKEIYELFLEKAETLKS